MGKGDKKTKRGKIHRGTFGVLRPRGKKAKAVVVSKPKKAAPKKAAAKKAVAKKEA